jgi:hypothetical protein
LNKIREEAGNTVKEKEKGCLKKRKKIKEKENSA